MLCFRQTPEPSRTRSRARLTLEALDPRLSPSSLLDNPTPPALPTDPFQIGAPGSGLIPAMLPRPLDAPPQITNFTAVAVSGGLWRFTGAVTDEAPGNLVVRFGGDPISLQTATATTDTNGHFDLTVLLRTDGSDNGLASAQTTDALGQYSNLALYSVSPG